MAWVKGVLRKRDGAAKSHGPCNHLRVDKPEPGVIPERAISRVTGVGGGCLRRLAW